MGDFGIKVGSNLNTNTALQLKFTTKFLGTTKLYKYVNASFTTDGSGVGSVEVPHDLGYIPIVEVWGKHTASFSFLSGTTYPNSWSLLANLNSYRPYGNGIDYYADDEKITIRAIAVGGIGGGVLPSTTYHFRVLIYVDKSEDFNGASTIALNDDFGFKNSINGVNVFTGQEYQMQSSSKYKALQYYDNHVVSSSLTLPEMWATEYDTQVQEATYVDFNHNLGYPPVFQLFSDLGTSYVYEAPYGSIFPVGMTYEGLYEVSAWCDASRVRVLFHRESVWQSGDTGQVFSAETINLNVIIFTENLEGEES